MRSRKTRITRITGTRSIIRRPASKVAAIGLLLIMAVTLSANSCDKANAAAKALNKYIVSLNSFHDAASIEHSGGRIDDATYASILAAEKIASQTGRDLNQAVKVAQAGGDTSALIAAAQTAADNLLKSVGTDQTLITAVNAAIALLQNTISLIHEIPKASSSSIPVHNPNRPASVMWFLFAMGLPLMVAGAGTSIAAVLALINELIKLEPVAFNLVVSLVDKLKGLTTDQITALNDQLLDQLDQKIADEEAKLGGGGGDSEGK